MPDRRCRGGRIASAIAAKKGHTTMARRIAFVFLAVMLVTRLASAQRAEASFNIGYSASEGISSDQRPLLGQLYDTIAVDSGASVNFTFGVNVTPNSQVEFLWARQNSRLQADGAGGKLPFSELAVYNYMFNYVYNLGEHDARVRPYFFGGLGATNYSFGNIPSLAPPATSTARRDSPPTSAAA